MKRWSMTAEFLRMGSEIFERHLVDSGYPSRGLYGVSDLGHH
jgi:hypothetical protein